MNYKFFLLFPVLLNLAAQPASDTTLPMLELRKPIERQIDGSQVHSYGIRLVAGNFLRAVVDQRGIDVAVASFEPDGKKIYDVDSPNGSHGLEPISFEAKTSGTYRLEVRPLDRKASEGMYEIKVEAILNAEQYAAYLKLEQSRQKAAMAWLSGNAVRLRTVEAGNGFQDLQPLKKMIGKARIVALGEATHGTREFFQFKHRMLEFLVSEMGFTLFGIEATMPEAFDINEYVLTGHGDPVKALAGLYFWTWDTEEVLDMIRWMRSYNADPSHIKKVKFYGFDMQFAPRAIKVALNYLKKVDREEFALKEKSFAVLANPFLAADFQMLPELQKEKSMAAIRSLLARFEEQKTDWIRRTNETEWKIAKQHARIAAQYIETTIGRGQSSSERDRSMADNIRWILQHEGPEAKMVVWAHNGHVGTFPEAMGRHLRKMFGPAMIVVGFLFNQGSFQAIDLDSPNPGLRVFEVGSAPEGTLDASLASAGDGAFLIDLRALPQNGHVKEWFSASRKTRGTGAVFRETYANVFGEIEVNRVYDALFFVNKTTAARAVDAGRRPPVQTLSSPSNLDFENSAGVELPYDWIAPPDQAAFDFEAGTSSKSSNTGHRSAFIVRSRGNHYGEKAGKIWQQIDAAAYQGKRISLRAAIRFELTAPENKVYLWLAIQSKGSVSDAPIVYSCVSCSSFLATGWRKYQIRADVPAEANTIGYGLALVGNGKAWFDSVSIEATSGSHMLEYRPEFR